MKTDKSSDPPRSIGNLSKLLSLVSLLLVTKVWAAESPYKVTLDPATAATLDQPKVAMRAADKGIGVEVVLSDYPPSTYMEQYSVGANIIGSAIAAAIIQLADAPAINNAKDTADRMVDAVRHEDIFRDVEEKLRTALARNPLFKRQIEIAPMTSSQKIEAIEFSDNLVLAIDVWYGLSADLRYLHVLATAHLFDKSRIPNPSDKKSKGKAGASKNPELLHRNLYEYYSERIDPAPERTRAEIDAAIAAVRAKYPKQMDSFERQKFKRDSDPVGKPFTQSERMQYLEKVWLADDAALLKEKLRVGVAEVVKLIAKDVGNGGDATTIAAAPPKTIIEQSENRVIVRYGKPLQGSLGSEPEKFDALVVSGGVNSRRFDPPKKRTSRNNY